MTFLTDINDLAEQVEFGEMQLTLKRHNGKTTSLVVNQADKLKFQSNSEAVAFMLSELKNLTESGGTASSSFTVMVKDGKIQSVIQQGYTSKEYK